MKLIVACDPKGGIGYNNKLPWSKIEGDLPRFKDLTSGQTIVMGRNTWDSLPKKPLPNRTNIIITSLPLTRLPDNTSVVKSLEQVDSDAWIIGGAKLIQSSWDYVSEVHLTRTFTEYTCDTYINVVQLEEDFMCWFKEQHEDHTYEIWKRK
jgi:dihydrofolate reductase